VQGAGAVAGLVLYLNAKTCIRMLRDDMNVKLIFIATVLMLNAHLNPILKQQRVKRED
jgi:hypothetical protein